MLMDMNSLENLLMPPMMTINVDKNAMTLRLIERNYSIINR